MLGDSFRTVIIKAGGNRWVLRFFYYLWLAFPYRLRRLVTALFISVTLKEKKWFGSAPN